MSIDDMSLDEVLDELAENGMIAIRNFGDVWIVNSIMYGDWSIVAFGKSKLQAARSCLKRVREADRGE